MTDKQLKDRAIDFKGSEYVQVKDRVLYLAENYDGRYWIDQTYEYFPDNKMWVVKTTLTIRDEDHDNRCEYVWLAQEIEWSSFINKTSALENACTSSLWRAIACLWIGVIDSFASINEIEKAENRAKAIKKEADNTPFKEEPSNPEPSWFEKAKQWVKFMQECLDEEDYIGKVKARVKEIWAKMTKQQETDLRICYQNAKAMENLPFN